MINKKNYFKILFLTMLVFSLLLYPFSMIFNSHIKFSPDRGPSWYLWKTTHWDWVNVICVWSLFIIHFIGNIYLIIKIQRFKPRGFNNFHVKLYFFNVIFIILHYVQTALNFDGLAKYIPIWTSQGSVIVLLVVMLVMLSPLRGFIFGKKINSSIVKPLYPIHGFFFVFAITLTFWYHPLYFTFGHLLGFIYIFILMAQYMMVTLKPHTNIKWLSLIETFVFIHAIVIAVVVQKSANWEIFAFGFATIFMFSTIYGLIKNKNLIIKLQIGFGLIYITYYIITIILGMNKLFDLVQIIFIPLTEYGFALLLILILSFLTPLITKKTTKLKIK